MATTSPSAGLSDLPIPSATVVASIAPAPCGAWTGINWVAEGKVFPQAQVTVRFSADGVHWTAPRPMDLPVRRRSRPVHGE
jgi:hypothetical protein